MNNIPVEDFEFDDTTHIETSPHKSSYARKWERWV